MPDDRHVLTTEEAIAMLPDGDSIHTFLSGPMFLIGADLSRDKIIEAIRDSECELGGEQCTAMGHGLVVNIGDSPLFVETRKEKADA